MVEIHTLGPLEIAGDDGHTVSVNLQPKRLAMLAYLAVARPPGLHRRDTLLGLFWPELDQPRARHALSQSLHSIRKALGTEAVVTRGNESVGLDWARVRSDAHEFERALDRGAPEDALALYRGDLLDGVFVTEAPGFEHWVEDERARIRTRAAAAARELAERCGREGRVTHATRWAARAAELDPLDERALRRLMRARDRAGDRAGALRAYQTFAARLVEELETEPSPETRALVDEIRDRDSLGNTSTSEEAVVARAGSLPPIRDPAIVNPPTLAAVAVYRPAAPSAEPANAMTRRPAMPRFAPLIGLILLVAAALAAATWLGLTFTR
ncbi:MAG TPA: BTAD domain-containing putative transcriptional regulator [Gemmatimonadaceae bacterium]|nr:BTAD domain-containing putative transcriptional regulator [Gemmatimonadaceae bacterium]